MTIKCDFAKCWFLCALGRQSNFKVGPLLTLFSNPLPTPLLTRPLKNYFYRHFGVSDCHDICTTPVTLQPLLRIEKNRKTQYPAKHELNKSTQKKPPYMALTPRELAPPEKIEGTHHAGPTKPKNR